MPKGEAVSEIKGFASSAGVSEGPARVLKLLKEIVDLQPGEIMVCPSTNPSWAPVFTKIKAAVTDIGGLTPSFAGNTASPPLPERGLLPRSSKPAMSSRWTVIRVL